MKNLYIYLLVLVALVIGAGVQLNAKPSDTNASVGKEDGDKVEVVTETASSVLGTYGSGMLPAASTPGRVFTLVLADAGKATLTADYQTDAKPVVETGAWELKDGRVTLTLDKRFGFAIEKPVVLTFTAGNGSLALVDYDISRWGKMGLTLKRAQ